MKYKTLRFTLVSLLMMVCGTAFAEDVTLAAGTNGTACTVNNQDGIKVGTSKAGGTMTITVPANSVKLTLHAAAWKGVSNLSVTISGATTDPESITLNADDGVSNNSPFTLAGDEDNFEFEIALSNITTETTLTFEAAKRFVVWGASAEVSSGGTPVVNVATPTFTPNGGKFVGTTSVEIACETEGATIYYSMNGQDPVAGSSPQYGRALPITETTTVKAIAVKGNDQSAVASATFTQIPSYTSFTSMSSLANNDIFAYTGKAFIIAKPTDKYVYIYNPDERDFALVYDASGEKTAAAEVGKYITPGWTGKVSIYKNLFELVPDDAIVVNDDPAQPVNYPDIALGNAVMNQVFTLKDITSYSVDGKNITIKANGDDKDISEAQGVYGYNQFGITIPECEEGKTYQMVGAIGQYNDKVQFWPIEITEQVEETPEPDPEFYLVGTMTNGEIDAQYKMTLNEALVEQGIKEFSITTTLTAGTEFKAVSSTDGENIKSWFPSEGDNYVIAEDGTYTIYLRPNGDGNNDWHEKMLYAKKNVEAPASTLIKPTVGITERYTSIEALDGKAFAIINEADQKALYGTDAQNLGYDSYGSAFLSSNSGYLWKLEPSTVEGAYLLRLQTPNGDPYFIWGKPGYLNSQSATGWCSFILGLVGDNNDHTEGQDGDYLATWFIEYAEGQGFALKNKGTGLYKGANGGTANSETPVYFTFAAVGTTYVPTVKDLLAEGEVWKAIVTDETALKAYNTAVAGIDPEAIEGDGLTEAKKIDAAIVALSKAQPAEANANFTRAIANPSFEVGSIDGWTSINGGNSANNGNFGAATGSFFVERWTASSNKLSDGTLLQTITELPAGKYKLTAEMQNREQGNGDAAGKGFFLVAGKAKTEAVANNGTTFEVVGATTTGTLEIGTKLEGCTGNWVCVDNFTLTLVEAFTAEYVDAFDALAAAIAEAKSIDAEGKQGADLLALAITAAETALNADDATVDSFNSAKRTLDEAMVAFRQANTFTVTIDDGDVDAANWQADCAEQLAGEIVTLTYGGKKKVKSITIEEVAAESTENKNEWQFIMPANAAVANIVYDTELALDEVDDNTEKLEEWDGYEANITLARTLQTGGYNTFAAPFNVSSDMLGYLKTQYGMKVKELTEAAYIDETIYFDFDDAESIEAGKPYLVKVESNFDFSAQAFPGIEVSKEINPVETDCIDFIPTLGKTTIGSEGSDASTVLFLGANNTLLNPTELPADMKGFRAYFQLKGDATQARAFSLDFGDGETTGIKAIDNGKLAIDNVVYDLQGRKVQNAAAKGMYIVNGKKVIIK